MYRLFKLVVSLIWLLSLVCCEFSKQKVEIVALYSKPSEEKIDSVMTWFVTQENFNKKEYLASFYQHFERYESTQNWEKAAELLMYVGESIYVNRKSDSTISRLYTTFLQKHENDISDRYKSGLLLNLGILHYYNSNIHSSIKTLTKTTQIPHSDYFTLLNITTAYNELAYNYTELGKYDNALDCALRSLDGYKSLNDTLGMGASYDAVSQVYLALEDYKNAETYIEKSIETLKSGNEASNVFEVYAGKLDFYEFMDNPKLYPFIDTVFNFYQKQDFQNDFYKIIAYSWKASKYLEEKNLEEAGKLIHETLPLFNKSNEKFLYGKYIETISRYEQLIGRPVIDSKVYKDGLVEYKKSKNTMGQLACYGALMDEALRLKDYKNAYLFSQEYAYLEDSLSSKNLIIKTKELDRKYQIEKKEQQILLQETELSQKNTTIALLAAVLGGIIIAIFTFYLWNRQKKFKQEKENSMNFTKQLLQNTEEERKRIAGDLHDSISHELLNLKSIFTQDISVVYSKIDTIINDIRGISRNLHPVMFDKIGLVPNIEALLERVQNQNNFFISTDIQYSGSLSSSDELQVYRIIQEAFNNIIKYSQAHAAKIIILEESDSIKIEIKDNGHGFNVKETMNSRKAFGLHNIIERSRIIGGEANIVSSLAGTIITIQITKKS